MRSIFTSVVVLGAAVWLLGCPGDRDVTPPPPDPYVIPGTVTETVTIQVPPAASNQPQTVRIHPPLPRFEPPQFPAELKFELQTPGNAPPRWAKIAVRNFDIGNPQGCDEMTKASNSCVVEFQKPNGVAVFKYDLVLYKDVGTDPTKPVYEIDLVIDPVGIIKG